MQSFGGLCGEEAWKARRMVGEIHQALSRVSDARKGGQPIMSNYDQDQVLYDDDDERFYEETVYNEEYYIKRERELIRQLQPTTLAHFPFPCCKRRSPRRIHPKHGNDNPSASVKSALLRMTYSLSGQQRYTLYRTIRLNVFKANGSC